jgi:hypothetical protein
VNRELKKLQSEESDRMKTAFEQEIRKAEKLVRKEENRLKQLLEET